jgi:very-short-patch-repair endonuclease
MRESAKLNRQHSALLVSRARDLRARTTRSEEILWNELRGGRLGAVFRRQVPLGGRYIADFFSASARVVVEVDGASHRGRAARDARRDRVLRRLGYRVVRLEAELVERDPAEAVRRIRVLLAR